MANHDRETTQPTCQNCSTSTTPLWRRDEMGSVLCNACGLFLKLHGRPRPISLKTDVIKSRNRVKTMRPELGMKKKVRCCRGPTCLDPSFSYRTVTDVIANRTQMAHLTSMEQNSRPSRLPLQLSVLGEPRRNLPMAMPTARTLLFPEPQHRTCMATICRCIMVWRIRSCMARACQASPCLALPQVVLRRP